MLKQIFENYNVEDLMRLRNALLDGEKKEKLLSQLDEIYMENCGSTVMIGKDIKHLLKGFDIEMLYLNKRSQTSLIAYGCDTVFDITKIKDLYSLPHIGTSSVNNIKVNMMFIEKYLYELCDRNRGAEFIKADDYDEKYRIIVNRKGSIFSYLGKYGEEFFFANSDLKSVNKCQKYMKQNNSQYNMSAEEYRIMRCLAQYSFLDDLERVENYDIDAYKTFDKFITKKKVK